MDRPNFKAYRILEAQSALTDWPMTTQGDVALRLLVNKSTVSGWARRSGASEMLSPEVVEAGRLTRRLGEVRDAPFVIGKLDEEPFLRACLGELSYWLYRERLITRQTMDDWTSRVKDGSVPLETRAEVVSEARQTLRGAVPGLFKPPSGP